MNPRGTVHACLSAEHTRFGSPSRSFVWFGNRMDRQHSKSLVALINGGLRNITNHPRVAPGQQVRVGWCTSLLRSPCGVCRASARRPSRCSCSSNCRFVFCQKREFGFVLKFGIFSPSARIAGMSALSVRVRPARPARSTSPKPACACCCWRRRSSLATSTAVMPSA